MRAPSTRVLLALPCLLLAACAGRSDPPRTAEPTVLEKTWGEDWRTNPDFAYAADGDPYERRYDGTKPKIDLAYYERHMKKASGDGEPLPLLEQFVFEDLPSSEHVGDPAPEPRAEFVAADGRRVRLADYLGRPVVLVFTRGFPGYICPLCTTYTAQISASYPRLREAGAEVLLVFPGDTTKVDEFIAACRAILEEEGPGALPFPVLLDPELAAVDRFNLRADLSKPATYVLDGQGSVRYAYVGTQSHERPSVDRILAEVEALARTGAQ